MLAPGTWVWCEGDPEGILPSFRSLGPGVFPISLPPLCVSPVAACTLEELTAAAKRGFRCTKTPVGRCYPCSNIPYSTGNKSCPLSVQICAFILMQTSPAALWSTLETQVLSVPPCEPAKPPFLAIKPLLVKPSALRSHRALLLLGGAQPK